MKKINLIIFTLLILIIALGTAIYLKSRPATEENIVSIPPPPAEPIKNRLFTTLFLKSNRQQQNRIRSNNRKRPRQKPSLPFQKCYPRLKKAIKVLIKLWPVYSADRNFTNFFSWKISFNGLSQQLITFRKSNCQEHTFRLNRPLEPFSYLGLLKPPKPAAETKSAMLPM